MLWWHLQLDVFPRSISSALYARFINCSGFAHFICLRVPLLILVLRATRCLDWVFYRRKTGSTDRFDVQQKVSLAPFGVDRKEACSSTFFKGSAWELSRHSYSQQGQGFDIHLSGCSCLRSLLIGVMCWIYVTSKNHIPFPVLHDWNLLWDSSCSSLIYRPDVLQWILCCSTF